MMMLPEDDRTREWVARTLEAIRRDRMETMTMPAPFAFGVHAPCRHCGGSGRRPEPLKDDEKRARRTELRQAKKAGQRAGPIPCAVCYGVGYLPIEQVDMRRPS